MPGWAHGQTAPLTRQSPGNLLKDAFVARLQDSQYYGDVRKQHSDFSMQASEGVLKIFLPDVQGDPKLCLMLNPSQKIPGGENVLLGDAKSGAPGVRDDLLKAEALFRDEQAAWRRKREATSAFKTEQPAAPGSPVIPSAPIYERLLKKQLTPEHEALAHLRLGQLNLMSGSTTDAAQQFAELSKITLTPDAMRAVRKELLALALAGQSSVVPRGIFEGIVDDPESRATDRKAAQIQVGHALLREGNTAEAVVAFEKALQAPGLTAPSSGSASTSTSCARARFRSRSMKRKKGHGTGTYRRRLSFRGRDSRRGSADERQDITHQP